MEYTTLGRTGLKASVAGLGCGGSSRLGQASGATEAESVALIRHCLDLGVNILDTAANYGTETVVGKAVAEIPRDQVILSTKSRPKRGQAMLSGLEVVENLHASLQRLGTDHVEIFHLHAVRPGEYKHCLNEIVPFLEREREKGNLRFIGLTESPPNDAGQVVLQQAVQDAAWDVIMVGYHMLNQKPRERVFPATMGNGIGTMIMFAVRAIFSVPGRLEETISGLIAEGKLPSAEIDPADPLGFVSLGGGASGLIDAAHRYVRHTPGADVILFGTGSKTHAEANVASILAPPLPEADLALLHQRFCSLEGVGLTLPER